jgi:hypothetical protein
VSIAGILEEFGDKSTIAEPMADVTGAARPMPHSIGLRIASRRLSTGRLNWMMVCH